MLSTAAATVNRIGRERERESKASRSCHPILLLNPAWSVRTHLSLPSLCFVLWGQSLLLWWSASGRKRGSRVDQRGSARWGDFLTSSLVYFDSTFVVGLREEELLIALGFSFSWRSGFVSSGPSPCSVLSHSRL